MLGPRHRPSAAVSIVKGGVLVTEPTDLTAGYATFRCRRDALLGEVLPPNRTVSPTCVGDYLQHTAPPGRVARRCLISMSPCSKVIG